MPYYGQPNLDARGDLGYGRVKPRFHVSRQRGTSYPYTEPDPNEVEPEDFVEDEDTIDAIAKKTLAYTELDPFAVNKSNPFYYGAGNLKLSDCFWRTDRVLQEINAMGTSMSPIPQLHRGPRVNLGPSMSGDLHAQYLTPGNFKRTGTLSGWSHEPGPNDIDDDLDDERIYSLEDFINTALRIEPQK
jgi:hypothetical protein